MSGRTIGTFAGAAIGFFVPVIGPALGATVGGMIGGALDPERFKGPSLGDIPLQTSQEGVPCPIIFGTPPPFPGNVIMIGPVLRTTEDVEQDKGGPVVEEKRIHQTYAVRICKGPAEVLKAWRDGKLVYDRTGTGNIDAESAAAASRITFYTGSETQLPDPVLEALPAEHGGGAGEVNAHRGRAYMVVDRDNLTGTGGRIPNWTFLMASSAVVTPGYSGVQWIATNGNGKFGTSLGGTDWTTEPNWNASGLGNSLLYGGGVLVASDDTDTRYSIDLGLTWTVSTFDSGGGQYTGFHGVYLQGKFWLAQGPTGINVAWSNNGASFTSVSTGTPANVISVTGRPGLMVVGYNNSHVAVSKDGGQTWTKVELGATYTQCVATNGSRVMVFSGPGGSFAKYTDDGDTFSPTWPDAKIVEARSAVGVGSLWVVTGNNGIAYSTNGGDAWTLATLPDTFHGMDVKHSGGLFVAVGRRSESSGIAVILTSTDGINWTERANNFGLVRLSSVTPIDCGGIELPDSPGYFVLPDGTICGGSPGSAVPNTVYLGAIETEIARLCGIPWSKFDVSEIATIPVQGYMIGKQMTGADALRPLAMLHFHTLPEYDGQIHAKLLGGPSVVTLTDDDFVDAPEEDEEIRAQSIELPRKLNLYFADPSSEYAIVPMPAERFSGNVQASSLIAIEAPLTLDRDVAAQKADILLKLMWEEAQGRLKRELPAFKYSYLTDADPFRYDDKRWRIVRMDTLETTIRIEAVRDRVSNLTSYATAGNVLAPTAPPRTLRGPTIFHAMNLPSLRSVDNQPGIYVAGTGILDGWQGYDLYISVDGGLTEQKVARITDRATIGYLLENITATQDDSSGPIPVRLYDGRTLESVTQAQLDARENAFVMTTAGVSEIAQVKTVTEDSNGDFDLTDVVRGLLGTTPVLHGADDPFVLLDGAVRFIPIDVVHAGQNIILRPVSIGTAVENNDTYTITFEPPTFVVDGGGDA